MLKRKKETKQIQELLLGSAVRKEGKQDSRQMCGDKGRVLLKQGHGLESSRNGKINDEEKEN